MINIAEAELKKIWDMVFNLSLGFLHDENAAEEATQDVFLKVNESISTFRHESSLSTWIYRIAYNYLVDQKRSQSREEISFEAFEQDVDNSKPFENELRLSKKEMDIYIEQIKIGCTKAMLQCLDPIDRLVFIFGKIFEFSSKDGAEICDMTEDAYRQRLSRASKRITNFMTLNCGQINPNATCHCKKRIRIALERHRINPDMLLHSTNSKKIKDYLAGMNSLDAVAEIFRDNPYIEKSEFYTDEIHQTIEKLVYGSI
jgi:RNA polymerase sigma factor (sigma-70 family)